MASMRSCSCHGQSLWRMLCLLPWRALLSKNDLSNSATSPGVCLANPARRKKDTQGTKFSPCVSFHCFFLSFFCFGGWVWRVGVKWAVCDFREAKKNFLADPCDFPESSTLLILSLTLQLDESYRCLALDPRVLALQAIDATDPLITSGTS